MRHRRPLGRVPLRVSVGMRPRDAAVDASNKEKLDRLYLQAIADLLTEDRVYEVALDSGAPRVLGWMKKVNFCH